MSDDLRLDRARRAGDVTRSGATWSGMAYEWGCAGPGGAWFTLLREPHHTLRDVEVAKHILRNERDVESLGVERVLPP